MSLKQVKGLFRNPGILMEHISEVLHETSKRGNGFPLEVFRSPKTSSVLFPLTWRCNNPPEPCVVFNKRSLKVRQPGDLCFPGGSVAPRLDFFLSRVLKSPFSPLARWRFWPQWREQRRAQANRLSLLLATGLRESVEEMRLNPFGVTFLGPMPSEDLRMFSRILYPMVVWINRQKHFVPNWEVEKIVHVPLRDLLNAKSYACYRLHFKMVGKRGGEGYVEDFPCFRYEKDKDKEVLWGATFRIVVSFLEMVFGFTPPSMHSLPVIHNSLDQRYVLGSS